MSEKAAPSRKKAPEPVEDRLFTLAEVEERLAKEATAFDAARGGVHRYNNIRAFNGDSGANWTANYGGRGADPGGSDTVQLAEMRDALKRVQAEMPRIDFRK